MVSDTDALLWRVPRDSSENVLSTRRLNFREYAANGPSTLVRASLINLGKSWNFEWVLFYLHYSLECVKIWIADQGMFVTFILKCGLCSQADFRVFFVFLLLAMIWTLFSLKATTKHLVSVHITSKYRECNWHLYPTTRLACVHTDIPLVFPSLHFCCCHHEL